MSFVSCQHDTASIACAKLLARVCEEFPLACPNCGGGIRLISVIVQPEAVRKGFWCTWGSHWSNRTFHQPRGRRSTGVT